MEKVRQRNLASLLLHCGDSALVVLAGVTTWKASVGKPYAREAGAGGGILKGKSTRCAKSELAECHYWRAG